MAAPTIVSIEPASGPPGTQVGITGTGFTNDTLSVQFGTRSAGTQFAVVEETELVVVAPITTGTVHITVTTPEGTSTQVQGDMFTYDTYEGPPGGGDGNPPVVNSLTPNYAIDNDGGDTVIIRGTGFTTTLAVWFGINQAQFTVVSATEISVLTPAGSGVVDVSVVTTYGTSANTVNDNFTYPVRAIPTVTGVAPNSGFLNSKVTITGTNFSDATVVYFGTETATFLITSATTITAYAPDTNGTVHVTVVNPGGVSVESNADLFTYGVGGLPVTTATNVQPNGFIGWSYNPVTVTLTAVPGSGYGIAATYYTIDLSGQTAYTGPFTISTPGSHMVTYWSVDTAGQMEPIHTAWVNILSGDGPPTGLSATAIGTGAVLVSWDAVLGLTQVSYKLYTGPTSTPTTLVTATMGTVISVKQPITDGARYFAVSCVRPDIGESARSASVGPVTAGLIVRTEITEGSISTPQLAANAVTADKILAGEVTAEKIRGNSITGDQIHANVVLSAPVITFGSLSGVTIDASSTITGATIRTAGSGRRVEMSAAAASDISFHDEFGTTGVVYAGYQNLTIYAPQHLMIYAGTSWAVNIAVNDVAGRIALTSSTVRVTGTLNVDGKIMPLTNCAGGQSDDGIWISDLTSPSRRWKLYMQGRQLVARYGNGGTEMVIVGP